MIAFCCNNADSNMTAQKVVHNLQATVAGAVS
jgi:hypothetical protein